MYDACVSAIKSKSGTNFVHYRLDNSTIALFNNFSAMNCRTYCAICYIICCACNNHAVAILHVQQIVQHKQNIFPEMDIGNNISAICKIILQQFSNKLTKCYLPTAFDMTAIFWHFCKTLLHKQLSRLFLQIAYIIIARFFLTAYVQAVFV